MPINAPRADDEGYHRGRPRALDGRSPGDSSTATTYAAPTPTAGMPMPLRAPRGRKRDYSRLNRDGRPEHGRTIPRLVLHLAETEDRTQDRQRPCNVAIVTMFAEHRFALRRRASSSRARPLRDARARIVRVAWTKHVVS